LFSPSYSPRSFLGGEPPFLPFLVWVSLLSFFLFDLKYGLLLFGFFLFFARFAPSPATMHHSFLASMFVPGHGKGIGSICSLSLCKELFFPPTGWKTRLFPQFMSHRHLFVLSESRCTPSLHKTLSPPKKFNEKAKRLLLPTVSISPLQLAQRVVGIGQRRLDVDTSPFSCAQKGNRVFSMADPSNQLRLFFLSGLGRVRLFFLLYDEERAHEHGLHLFCFPRSPFASHTKTLFFFRTKRLENAGTFSFFFAPSRREVRPSHLGVKTESPFSSPCRAGREARPLLFLCRRPNNTCFFPHSGRVSGLFSFYCPAAAWLVSQFHARPFFSNLP